MKSITFFMHNIYAMGGTVKSISQLANVLAEKGHQIEIISVFRGASQPYFDLHDSIQIRSLTNYQVHPLNIKDIFFNRIHKYTPFSKPSILSQHEPGLNQFSHYIEKKMIKSIRNVSTDTLIGTRASFNILIACYGSQNIEKIGMEHMNFEAHSDALQDEIATAYKHLDKITTLTESDKHTYESIVNVPVYIVPNILNEPRLPASKDKIITAAGRLEYEKGFDLLIKSIIPIQQEVRRFKYQIHIYGDGEAHALLQQLIIDHQLADIIKLQGATQQLNEKLAMSEITVVPSRNEGFGMVILEAMNQSNIVVSFNGNAGPDSLINNNVNGYLVTHGSIEDLSNQLLRLINQEFNKQHLIENAYQTVQSYSPDSVYQSFQTMLES
ncbi:glycosyltransferase family 4 protein [Staphylococcus nepalensis]|uniref:glycosyltransferase family 4 protein n=1 Tax=Staphylococcus nepalensis TaxID=214473 RepID=UPI0024B6D8EB|nr:glycosyltransferase family 4 protein [Staphylococcus nepalensis]MDR5649050.1 glycosyltransferase family 4 protein [Staphylococcus nepalensis]